MVGIEDRDIEINDEKDANWSLRVRIASMHSLHELRKFRIYGRNAIQEIDMDIEDGYVQSWKDIVTDDCAGVTAGTLVGEFTQVYIAFDDPCRVHLMNEAQGGDNNDDGNAAHNGTQDD